MPNDTDQPTLAVTQAQDDLAFVENFGANWLDGSVTAKTVLLAYLVKSRTHFEPRPAGDLREARCGASPDHADIMETIENAADDWQKQGYTSALAEVRDMANVGRALMEALPKGYSYMNCPSEIVSDLQNERDEALATHSPAPMAGEDRTFKAGLWEAVSTATTLAVRLTSPTPDEFDRGYRAGLQALADNLTAKIEALAAHPSTQEV